MVPHGAKNSVGYPTYWSFFIIFISLFPVFFSDVLKKCWSGKGFKISDNPLLIKTPFRLKGGDSFPYNNPRRVIICKRYISSIKVINGLTSLAVNHPHKLQVLLLKSFVRFCFIKGFERLDRVILLEMINTGFKKKVKINNSDVKEVIFCICIVEKLLADHFKICDNFLEGECRQKLFNLYVYHFLKIYEFLSWAKGL